MQDLEDCPLADSFDVFLSHNSKDSPRWAGLGRNCVCRGSPSGSTNGSCVRANLGREQSRMLSRPFARRRHPGRLLGRQGRSREADDDRRPLTAQDPAGQSHESRRPSAHKRHGRGRRSTPPSQRYGYESLATDKGKALVGGLLQRLLICGTLLER